MALRIDIKGHISDLQAKLGQAGSALRRFGRVSRVVAWRAEKQWQKFGAGIKKATGSFGGIGGKAVAALAGFFAIRQVTSMTKGLVDEMDRVGKAADRLGIGAESYQEMAFAAKLAGVTMERFTLAMSALGPFILNAANSSSKQAKALKLLNIEYNELAKMAPEQQFRRITSSIDKIANATERVGVSRLIFGRAGFEVLGMARNYDNAVSQIRGTGGIITDEEIAAAERFNDQLALMITRIKAIAANTGIFGALGQVMKDIGLIPKTQKEKANDAELQNAAKDLAKKQLAAEGVRPDSNIYENLLSRQIKKNVEEMGRVMEVAPSKKDIANKKKTVEDRIAAAAGAVGKAISGIADAGSGAAGGRFRVDALRRIGGLSGAPGMASGFNEQQAKMQLDRDLLEGVNRILAQAGDINKKTPAPNEGGKS